MTFGIIEVIALLMGMSGFSVGTNPKPPTAEQALEYAVADADIVAHFDAASVIPNNYKVFAQLESQPQIKASPELAKMVRKAVAEIDGPRGLVKQMTGVDLTTDVSDATAFVRIMPKQDWNVVLAAHGKFTAATLDKIGKLTAKPTVKAGAGAFVEASDGYAVGLTKNGVLLAGTAALIKERVADGWKPPALTPGTNLGNAAELIRSKPVFVLALMMSPAARTEALADMKRQDFVTDVLKRHKLVAFSVFRDGIGWSWIDSQKPGLDAMAQVSDGMIDLLRAAQIAPRGFAKIAIGALESYRGTNKQVDELIKRKADIQKLVETYTGDGTFKAQVDKDPARLKLTVRLTGKTLSEVFPGGGVLPLAVLGLVAFRGADSQQPPAQLVAPSLPPGPAAKKPAPAPGPAAKPGTAPKK